MIRELLMCALIIVAGTVPAKAELIPGQVNSEREAYLTRQLHQREIHQQKELAVAQTNPRFRALAKDVRAARVAKAKKTLKQRGFELPTDAEIAAALGAQGNSAGAPTPTASPLPVSPDTLPPTPTFPTNEQIAAAAGLDQQTGHVSNSQEARFKLQLDSFMAWVHTINSIKLGVSAMLFALDQNQLWRVNADVADNLAGLSLNYTMLEGIRAAVGAGYGRLFGEAADKADAAGKSKNTAYFKLSFRLW